MLRDYLVSAFRNLYRHKMRSLLTMTGIVIGIFAVTTVLSIGISVQTAVNQEFQKLGLNGVILSARENETGQNGLFDSGTLEAINASFNDVRYAMPLLFYLGKTAGLSGQVDCVVWGIGDNAQDVISLSPVYGRMFSSGDLDNGARVCVIDEETALSLYKRRNITGKTVELTVSGRTLEFDVIGVVSKSASDLGGLVSGYIPSFVYIPYTTLQGLTGTDLFDKIVVQFRDGADIERLGIKIAQHIMKQKNVYSGYYMENLVSQKNRVNNVLGIVTVFVSAVAGISLVVGGLGIMTIMLVAVNERKREIGIKKAVGATHGKILAEFLFEALIISLIGGTAGIGVSTACLKMVKPLFGFTARVNVPVLFLSLAFCALIGTVFSVYPAKKAASLNPIEALRYE